MGSLSIHKNNSGTTIHLIQRDYANKLHVLMVFIFVIPFLVYLIFSMLMDPEIGWGVKVILLAAFLLVLLMMYDLIKQDRDRTQVARLRISTSGELSMELKIKRERLSRVYTKTQIRKLELYPDGIFATAPNSELFILALSKLQRKQGIYDRS
ncbi:MAG: hypothetical protein INQ03_04915 [Candidatus Heimdallarchaeota archaeon]|nr:hypothetical protein [Candidatus Heimdallarchaeota archaeon]